MSEEPDNIAKPLKEQFVPFEQRESQKTNVAGFIYDMGKLILITKISAILGGFAGQMLTDRKIGKAFANFKKFNFSSTAINGKVMGGIVGSTYELHHHWTKEETNRLGAKSINASIRDAIDNKHLERETEQEKALVSDLQKLQAAMEKPKSFREDITNRREQAAQETNTPTL